MLSESRAWFVCNAHRCPSRSQFFISFFLPQAAAVGDTSAVAKKARRREEEAVELLPGPGGESETREGDDIDGEPMDSDAAHPPARSRAPRTCV